MHLILRLLLCAVIGCTAGVATAAVMQRYACTISNCKCGCKCGEPCRCASHD